MHKLPSYQGNIIYLFFIYLFICPFVSLLLLIIDRRYPVTVELKERYESTCKNKKLADWGEFEVDRKKSQTEDNEWDFFAYFGNKELSWLGAGDKSKNKGVCNNVKTEEHSRGCGMATTLMEFCFTDNMVGGIDVENDKHFKKDSLAKF